MALNTMSQVKIDEELFEACVKKDLNKVKALLLCGGDPYSIVKGKECAAILEMVWNNDDDSTDILKAILSSGTGVKDINVRTLTRYGNTPLLTACFKGNVQCAKLLVENGAVVTAKNNFGCGVLQHAVDSENLLMVKECLKWKGVNVNQRGQSNWTALTRACEKEYADIVRVLLSAGADVTLRDDYGYPAIWYARDNVEITNLFLNVHSNTQTETTSTTTSSLPTAIGALSLSSSSGTNQNITSVDVIIRRLFPKFDELKIRSTISTIQEAGVDFEDFDPQHLLVLEANDFEKVLKPVEARLLLKAFRDEYSTEKRPVINF